jgi:hypothetical protein
VPKPSDTVTDYYSSPSPTNYFNAGFLAYSADYFSAGIITESLSATETLVATCTKGPTTEFALIPTVTPPGFSDPYQAPVVANQWESMIPASLSKCSIEPPVFLATAAIALNAVSALTATSTQYDDYVHPQATSSSTGKRSTPAQNSLTTPTTKPNSEPSATPLAAQTPQVTSTTPALTSTPHASSILVVGPSTSTLPKTAASPAPVVVSGTTITPGGPAVTIGGTKYSLALSSPVLIIGSLTSTLASVTTLAPVVVAGTTITPGAPAVTIGGTTYSLAASSSVLVVDGSTLTPKATLTAASSGGVGSVVWSGIGGMEGSATSAGGGVTGSGVQVTTFPGAANRVAGGMDWRYWLAAVLVAVLAEW